MPSVLKVVISDLTNGHEAGITIFLLREESTQIKKGLITVDAKPLARGHLPL